MGVLDDFRSKHPDYANVPDAQLADGLYRKFYADKMSRADFDTKVGSAPATSASKTSQFGPLSQLIVGDQKAAQNPEQGRGSILDTFAQGLYSGWSDEAAGLAGGLWSAVTGRDPVARYNEVTDKYRNYVSDIRERNLPAAVASEIGGALAPALLSRGQAIPGQAARMGLGRAIATGTAEGAAFGANYGAGAAEGDIRDRIGGAVQGAVAGGLTGGAFPVVGAGIRSVASPVVSAVRARFDPQGYAAQKVLERMSISPQQAAARMERGPGMALMDVGGRGTQKLARSVRNSPYEAGNRLMTQGNIGAMAQGGRIKQQIAETLSDPNGYEAAKDAVIQARRTRATPYYDAAYQMPVPYTHELQAVLETPAGRRALAAARENSQNIREPWAQWFLNVADDGSLIDAQRVPDMRALDQVKKQLDEAVNAAMRPADGSPFGRPMATEASRAISRVRQDLLRILDDATTVAGPNGQRTSMYGTARQVAGESINWDQALELGRRALTMDSRTLRREIGNMSQDEVALARIGVAEALRKKIDEAGLTHNALLKVFGSREQINRLRPFFRSNEEWGAFRKAMFEEAKKRRSLDLLRGNSTTAEQLADMADAGQMGDMAAVAQQAARGNVLSAGLTAVGRALQRISGMTPETAMQMARLLASRNPEEVRRIATLLTQRAQSQQQQQAYVTAARQALTKLLAGQEGRQLAPTQPAQ